MYQNEWTDKWQIDLLKHLTFQRDQRFIQPLKFPLGSSDNTPREQPKITEDEARSNLRELLRALQRRLDFLNRWQKMERHEKVKEHSLGCVYLMWCPTFDAYKIGSSKHRIVDRIPGLRQNVDRKIEYRMDYLTPILHSFLEMAVHRHFRHFHFSSLPQNEVAGFSDELFKLPQKEADGFWDTAATIEQHLLVLEFAHLELRLTKLKVDLVSADK